MNDSDDVQRLIRLKRYESPGEEYYQAFAERFKERQRSEMLRSSARGLLMERIAIWFDESGGARRLVPAGALAAAAVGVGLYWFNSASETPASTAFADGPAVSGASVEKNEVIHLQIPRIAVPVPEGGAGAYPGGAVLPAGIQGGLREL